MVCKTLIMEGKQKAKYFPDEGLYGYTHPIQLNELKQGESMPVNRDVLPKNSLHSPEALHAAAQSLEDE